jgi:hypothetical protein
VNITIFSAIFVMLPVHQQRSVKSADAQQRTRLKLKETAMDTREYPTRFMKALAIGIIAAWCSGLAVPASAMPNMPHLFAEHEVARSADDVAHASEQYRYRNNSRGYSGDAASFYGYGPNSSRYP